MVLQFGQVEARSQLSRGEAAAVEGCFSVLGVETWRGGSVGRGGSAGRDGSAWLGARRSGALEVRDGCAVGGRVPRGNRSMILSGTTEV